MRKDTIYALEIIYSAVQNLLSKQGYYYRLRPFLPYCLYEIEGKIIPMNRDYKPIGLLNQEFVDYKCFNFLAIPHDLIDFSDLKDERDQLNPQHKAWWFFTDIDTPERQPHKKRYRDRIVNALFSKYGKDRNWQLPRDW